MTQTEPRRAPELTFKAVETGRVITLDKLEFPTVVMLVSQGSSEQTNAVVEAVRGRYPTVEEAQIVSVVDLRKFPKLVRKVAETLMAQRYKESAKNILEGRDPARYIVILPDWDAKAMVGFGIEDVGTTMAIAVVMPGGEVAGVYQGENPGAAALELLGTATNPPSATHNPE